MNSENDTIIDSGVCNSSKNFGWLPHVLPMANGIINASFQIDGICSSYFRHWAMEGLEGFIFLYHHYFLKALALLMPHIWLFVILQEHVNEINKTHLRDLLNDVGRSQSMMVYDTYWFCYFSFWKRLMHVKALLLIHFEFCWYASQSPL